MSSGWLGTFFPGEALPLDESCLTGFEALNPLLERPPDDSTERRIVCPARGFPAKRRRGTSSGWLGALLPGETFPLDEPRLTAFEALNPLFWRAPDDSTERRIVSHRGAGTSQRTGAPSAAASACGFPAKCRRKTFWSARRVPSRRSSPAGRVAPGWIRSTEPAVLAQPPTILRSVESSSRGAGTSQRPARPLPLFRHAVSRRNAAVGQAPAGSARSFPAKPFRWTNRA